MQDDPVETPPLRRVIPVASNPRRSCIDAFPRNCSTWVSEKATHQSLKAALRRVLSYQVERETASRVDVWFASALADSWIAGLERDVHAVLRLLVEHAIERSVPGGRVVIIVKDRDAGAELTVRDRAPDVDIGVLLDEHRRVPDARRSASELAALHDSAMRLGARVRAGAGVHAGSPQGLELIAQFPPPFDVVGRLC